jgi:hypothetical protein
MKRFVPLLSAVTALAAIAIVTAVAVGASSGGADKNAARQSEDSLGGSGVAAMCVQDHPDCNDMIVEGEGDAGRCMEGAVDCVDTTGGGSMNMCIAPDDAVDAAPECNDIITEGPNSGEGIDPGECSAVHNIEACNGTSSSSAGVTYDVTVPFDESVTDEDTKLVMEIVMAFDPDADVLLLESFPPTGRATFTTAASDACAAIESKLEGIPAVGDVTCAVAPADAGIDPDPGEPVSSEPGSSPSGGPTSE